MTLVRSASELVPALVRVWCRQAPAGIAVDRTFPEACLLRPWGGGIPSLRAFRPETLRERAAIWRRRVGL